MRLFLYYGLHSIWNQIRKIFKTWVLIFFVSCLVLGLVIGVFAASMAEKIEEQGGGSSQEEEYEDPEEDIPITPELKGNILELAAGGISLVVLAFFIMGADKNGGSFFLPADVTILFTSPLRPQSVLLFRIMASMGSMFFISLYLVFQMPNLNLNAGLSIGVCIYIMVAFFAVLITGLLLRTMIYMLCTTREKLKKYITPAVLAGVSLIAVAFLVYFKISGLTAPDEALFAFFNGVYSRFIPFWGWTKGMIAFAYEQNYLMANLLLAADIAGCFGLLYVIRHTTADFYEDALIHAEEIASLQQAMNEEGSLAAVKRKKDRSEKLERNGFNRGFGASVYFFKTMYNRRRFAILKLFTKTSITYLVTAVLVSAIAVSVFSASADYYWVCAVVLGVFVFFRSLGNPLEQDTCLQYFTMIPEKPYKKLFYSLLGSSCCCALDLLPGLIVSALIFRASPLVIICWLVILFTIDLYATLTGVFINISVPVSAGKSIKQVVQIMFIYFGLIPDIVLIVLGLVQGSLLTFAVITVAVNILISAVFFAAIPNFISPRSRRAAHSDISIADLKTARRSFSRSVYCPICVMLAGYVVQIILNFIELPSDVTSSDAYAWLSSFLPMYVIGLPLGLLVIKGLPRQLPEKHSISFVSYIKFLIVSLSFMYIANFAGSMITSIIAEATGTELSNVVTELITDGNMFWVVLFGVIIGPAVEEFIFRKLIIDITGKYGMALSVVFSALMFGFYHGNISQALYASALGLVFGYVYTKTGRLRYTIALHMTINFIGSVIPTLLLKNIDLEALDDISETGAGLLEIEGMGTLLIYLVLILLIVILGLVIFIGNLKKISFKETELEIPKGNRFAVSFLSSGAVISFLYFVFASIMSFTPA